MRKLRSGACGLMAGWLCVVLAAAPVRADEPEKKPATPPATQPAGESKSEAAKVKIGEDAPEFTLLDTMGKPHKLSEYKDKLVVLVWLNEECPYSQKSVPVVNDLVKKYGSKGVVWLGIDSTWNHKPEKNEEYRKEKELTYPVLMDTDGKVGKLYGAKTTPHVFVIHKGKLLYMGGLHNDQKGDKPKAEFRNYVDEALAAALDGKPVPVAETTPWGCGVKYKDKK